MLNKMYFLKEVYIRGVVFELTNEISTIIKYSVNNHD